MLSWTSFSEELLDSMDNLKFLKHLNICYCNFIRLIPILLESLTQITSMILSSNNFTRSILVENFTQITYLDLGENKFIGSILVLHGNLTQIIYLNMDENKFTGLILTSLENLTNYFGFVI